VDEEVSGRMLAGVGGGDVAGRAGMCGCGSDVQGDLGAYPRAPIPRLL
jgi:hypothetical protein